MAEGTGDGADPGEQAKPHASTTPGGRPNAIGSDKSDQSNDDPEHSIEAGARNLPMVIAPRLADDQTMEPDSEAVDEAPNQPGGDPAPRSRPSRPARFGLLAASVVVAAALGSFTASLSASGVARFLTPAAPNSATAEMTDALRVMNEELAQLSAMKASLDSANRGANTQFAKIADRLDRVERAQADPATKIAHIADTVDRLDKRSTAAPETTGSIAAAPQPAAASAQMPESRPPVLENWIVQGVQNGHALVASRFGGVFEVGVGSFLPGPGRVQTIKREDGHWIVVTARGVITSMR